MSYTYEVICADFKTRPFKHQLWELENYALDKSRALLWQMRTGKSKTIIDTACMLYRDRKINAVLLFAPNSVYKNWIDQELPRHHWDSVRRACFAWNTKLKNSPAQNRTFDYCLNTQNLTWFAFSNATMTRNDVKKLIDKIIDKKKILIVFDESHDFRTPYSKRSIYGRSIAQRCDYRRILTGTAVTNSPLHAWSQFELLQPGALGYRIYDHFKDRYADTVKVAPYAGANIQIAKTVNYINLDELSAKMNIYSTVIKRADCDDLPDIIRVNRQIELTEIQIKIYRELLEKYSLEINDQEVTFNENASKLIKLQQVCSGFIVDQFGNNTMLPGPNPKLDALIDEIERYDGKILIWCAFRRDIQIIKSAFDDKKIKSLTYYGGTPDEERQLVVESFKPDAENNYRALIGQPASAGLGLNLSAADKIIWYSHTFNAIIKEQADERATAIGGKNIELINFIAPGIDEYIIENLNNKINIAEKISQSNMCDVLHDISI